MFLVLGCGSSLRLMVGLTSLWDVRLNPQTTFSLLSYLFFVCFDDATVGGEASLLPDSSGCVTPDVTGKVWHV